jgi:hypothetical protein
VQLTSNDAQVADRLRAILNAAKLYGEMDLRIVSEEDLAQADVAFYGKIVYVASYLRLWNFLRRQPRGFEQENTQATLGLAFLRHAERDETFRKLLMGRRRGDDALYEDVITLRRKVVLITEQKAAALTRKKELIASREEAKQRRQKKTPVIDVPQEDAAS